MALVTYVDKETLEAHPEVPEINKFTAENAIEVKNAINLNAIKEEAPSVAGATIDLPLTNQEMVYNLGNLSGAKEFTFTGSETKKFTIKLPVIVIGALTFPASVVMSDSRWDGTAFTPDEIGTYFGKATLVGAQWHLEIPQLPSV